MNPAAEAPATLDALLAPLLHLPPADRLEVIARLAQSLKVAAEPAASASILDFAGAWADIPGTDAEITAAVRQARTFTRPAITLK